MRDLSQRIFMKKNYLLTLAMTAAFMTVQAQSEPAFRLVQQSLPNPDNEPAPVFPLPTERQMAGNRVLRLFPLWYEHIYRYGVGKR